MKTNLAPSVGEHAAIVGKTGSGKTTTAVQLLRAIGQTYPVLILDSKGEAKFEALGPVVERPEDLQLLGTEVYRPAGYLNEPPWLDALLQKVYEAGRTMYVYIDEGYHVANKAKPGRGLANLLMRSRHRTIKGRSVRMSTIVGGQRPAWIPRQVFTEATHYLVHQLTEEDRKTMYSYIGDRRIIDEPVTGHDFWYYSHHMEQAERMRLKLQ